MLNQYSAQQLGQLPMIDTYEMFHKEFVKLPQMFQDHRKYFVENFRGFGEDAFHAMWFWLFERYKPKNILEIGIYRGQTLSLFQLLANHFSYQADIWGISPLLPGNDSVSTYPNIDYNQDINTNFSHFGLANPQILKSSSLEKPARQLIKSRKWDLIYIDGNHDLPFVIADYVNCADALSESGILVMDDSSLNRDFHRAGAFRGHPAPSMVVDQLAKKELEWLFAVGHNNVMAHTP
jgi:hypothetical protein